jgi:hypothetical protein
LPRLDKGDIWHYPAFFVVIELQFFHQRQVAAHDDHFFGTGFDVRHQRVVFHVPHHFMAIANGLGIAQRRVKKRLQVIVLLARRNGVYNLTEV